ncbi:MAG TPA: hypothetical protein VIV14_07920 [Gammaproteobacteria bacterium]
MSFLAEIKRRHVIQVAVVYAVVGWGLIEVVATVEEPLGLPGWFDTFVIVLVIVGFPLALVVSWIFDLTPKGVVRTEAPDDANAEVARPERVSANTRLERPEVLRNSIAVLPLDNLSPNPDDAYFAAGIHEEILNYLAKINDLSVIARTSVKRYANSDIPIKEIAAELGVRSIMEGSVRYAGDKVRVTAQLIDAGSEEHLWSEVYERDLADVFAIQADIAEKIANALAAKLSPAEKQSIEKLPTSVPEAYVAYLQARVLQQDQGRFAAASEKLRSSIAEYLDQALEADPNFALAYAKRADLNIAILNQDPGTPESYERRLADLEASARRDLDRALSIDPDLADAYAVLGRFHQFNWRGQAALEAFERAVELSPQSSDVLIDYAVFLAIIGRTAEAIELGKRARQLDPNSVQCHAWLAYIYYQAGDPNLGKKAWQKTAELAPTLGVAHVSLAWLELRRGDTAESLRHLRIAERLLLQELNPVWLGELAALYAQSGLADDAQRMLGRIHEKSKTDRVPAATWICAYAGLGDREKLRYWLTQAIEQPEHYVGYFTLMLLKVNNNEIPVLDEPEFAALRERLGYQDLKG